METDVEAAEGTAHVLVKVSKKKVLVSIKDTDTVGATFMQGEETFPEFCEAFFMYKRPVLWLHPAIIHPN